LNDENIAKKKKEIVAAMRMRRPLGVVVAVLQLLPVYGLQI